MNTRRRMKMGWLNSLSEGYCKKYLVRYILEFNKLNKEIIYTNYSNECMRKTKRFGLPNRKEFEKQMEEYK